ncbi:damage-control phosphatase ARMT1 [Drosophila hydei]|uniref:Sugar phosphate phosphatase n=1 Tax=Drosophila hydei TaxID=7224 RepID=A0A6J1M909_DROHY|nr:damage-control phosphatase ARMT1 [Drosophila hydei]
MPPSYASEKAELLDVIAPRHSLLSGRYKQSFAYIALQSRMPGIMSQVTKTLLLNQSYLEKLHGTNLDKEIHIIIESIERLRKELRRDREFLLFHGNESDKPEWNAFISELPRPKRSYFRASWLHSECYLYRRIHSFFESSKYLRDFDYFADLKRDDLIISARAINCLTMATRGLSKNYECFSRLMRINLWSNHFDIQLAAFVFDSPEDNKNIDVLAKVADLDRRILVDESLQVWNCLLKAKGQKEIIVDYICDNSGFELFTDLLFVEYLIDQELATQVRLHVKAIPWYISDAMKSDVEWTISYLKDNKDEHVSSLGKKLERLMKSEHILVAPPSYFWTGPQSYFVMVDSNIELYKMLTQAQLAIFKGDLNYRKLLGDYIWDFTEEFITCLRGFRPTNMCAMRNVKCEVICGLPEGVADHLLKVDPNWMISGYYGVIQYTDSFKCKCDAQQSLCSLNNKA